MDALTEAMREAATDAPTSVGSGPGSWPEESWRRGRVRRAAVRAGTAAGALVVLALVAGLALAPLGVPRAALPAGDAREGVASYPQRIGHQWWVGDLPAQGVTLAGVAQVLDGDVYRWQPFDAGGTRYEVPGGADLGVWPALADDGTRLGFLTAEPGSHYRILDLARGSRTDYASVGTTNLRTGPAGFVGGRTYGVGQQSPAFFSRSGEWVALGGQRTDGWGGVLVLGPRGAVTQVPTMDQAAGWLDEDHLLGRVVPDGEEAFAAPGVELVVWDRRTGRTSTLGTAVLHPSADGWRHSLAGQWFGTVRGDGTLWLVGTDDREEADGSLTTRPWVEGVGLPALHPVALDGSPAGTPAPVWLDGSTSFQQYWAADDPLRGTDDSVVTVAAGPDAGRRVVVSDGLARVVGTLWARDALDGGPSWTPFGTSTRLLTWWWKELALAVVLLLIWRLWCLRRVRRLPSARGGAARRRSPAGR